MEELRKNLQALLQVLLCFPEYQVISMQELWGGHYLLQGRSCWFLIITCSYSFSSSKIMGID